MTMAEGPPPFGDDADPEPARPVDPQTLAFPLRPDGPHVGEGRSPAPAEAPPHVPPASPSWIGPYRLLETLGQGGMGTVFLAEQAQPLVRRVALKVIRAGRLDGDSLRRFDLEAQALARMSHPNIAQVFEAGRTPGGEPYLVMEYVPGLPVTVYCHRRRSSLDARLDLFASLCDGVQHAHQKAILHGDLKPSNVLVSEVGGTAWPKIIDFGIAKPLDLEVEGSAPIVASETSPDGSVTGSGPSLAILGTLNYLSPEAIDPEGDPEDVDTRSDVYALGVLLCELLAGVRPFRGRDREDVRRQILAGLAQRPSELFAALNPASQAAKAERRGRSAAGLRRALCGDLDAIAGKAMARDRSQRYASAAELAADVRRCRSGQPVLAAPQTAFYRTRKALRRHWVGAAAALLVALSLISGIAARSLEAERANREAARANREAEASLRVSDFLAELFTVSDPGTETRRDLTAREILDRGAQRLSRDPHVDPLVRGRLLDRLGNVYRSLGLYPKAEELLRQALALRERYAGQDSREVAETTRRLSVALRYQGKLDEAEAFLVRSLRVPNASPAERAGELLELASLDRARNRKADAEVHLKEVIALRQKALGPEDDDVAAAMNNLGNLYFDEGRFPEAEAVHLRALAIKRKALGPDHFFVAQSLANLSNVYIEMKRLPEAEALQESALAIKRKTLPAGHPEIGVSLSNLGEIAFNLRQFERAERYYREAMEVWKVQLPPDHPYFAYGWGGIANIEREAGRRREAEADYQRALALARRSSPPGSPLLQTLEADHAKLSGMK